MSSARGGVEYADLTIGTGAEASRSHVTRIELTIRLSRGEVVFGPEQLLIDLTRRETIAGIRYGIEGMRIGGRRELRVPPHLAYGKAGIPGKIPPDALLICEITLMEICNPA